MKIACRFFVLLTFVCCFVFGSGFSDEFYKIQNKEKRKEEFVKILTPLIEKANENVLKERKTIELFFQKVKNDGIENIGQNEKLMIEAIAKKYRIDSIEDKKAFDKKVAPVPVSLAIAQAAVESGWGNSRFVKEANNLYGQWIWTNNDKLGLIPAKREDGKSHRVRIFKSIQNSVNSYILNLNRHYAYKDFRDLRLEKKEHFNGFEAAEAMASYSEIREEYVKILKDVIRMNKLLKLDSSYKELLQTNKDIFIQLSS